MMNYEYVSFVAMLFIVGVGDRYHLVSMEFDRIALYCIALHLHSVHSLLVITTHAHN